MAKTTLTHIMNRLEDVYGELLLLSAKVENIPGEIRSEGARMTASEAAQTPTGQILGRLEALRKGLDDLTGKVESLSFDKHFPPGGTTSALSRLGDIEHDLKALKDHMPLIHGRLDGIADHLAGVGPKRTKSESGPAASRMTATEAQQLDEYVGALVRKHMHLAHQAISGALLGEKKEDV